MLTVLTISLREFLEVFLIIGVFLGISKKLTLHKEKEIILASILGITFSFLLTIGVFLAGDKARLIFTEKNADLLEGYLMIFSGFFIAYVIFSLHNFFALKRSKAIIAAHQKMQKNLFDFSLFLTIVFFVIREGFEIALFTATAALFTQFMQNVMGLFLGFTVSAVLGLLTFFAYIKFPIGKIFKYTEYFIILLGASFVTNGLSEICGFYFHIEFTNILPLKLAFLPQSSTFMGEILKTTFGLEREFSLLKIGFMMLYITGIYFLFQRRKLPQFSQK